MQCFTSSVSCRSTVALGRFCGGKGLRFWSLSTGDKHTICFRSSSSVSKIPEKFGKDHVPARIPSATSKDTSIQDLFAWARQAYPEKWRPECWYLTTAAALIASGQQTSIGALYQYVLQIEHLETPESRKHMVRRLREAMIKCIILNGIPKVMLAFHSLAAVEQEQDQEHSFTRAGWTPDEENRARAVRVLDIIYRGAQKKNHAACGAHTDIEWISTDISYGLFLSNDQVLDVAESELVILPAIMCQDLQGPTNWHLKGCLRVGFTREEVDAVQKVIEEIMIYSGRKLSHIGSVWDILDES